MERRALTGARMGLRTARRARRRCLRHVRGRPASQERASTTATWQTGLHLRTRGTRRRAHVARSRDQRIGFTPEKKYHGVRARTAEITRLESRCSSPWLRRVARRGRRSATDLSTKSEGVAARPNGDVVAGLQSGLDKSAREADVIRGQRCLASVQQRCASRIFRPTRN